MWIGKCRAFLKHWGGSFAVQSKWGFKRGLIKEGLGNSRGVPGWAPSLWSFWTWIQAPGLHLLAVTLDSILCLSEFHFWSTDKIGTCYIGLWGLNVRMHAKQLSKKWALDKYLLIMNWWLAGTETIWKKSWLTLQPGNADAQTCQTHLPPDSEGRGTLWRVGWFCRHFLALRNIHTSHLFPLDKLQRPSKGVWEGSIASIPGSMNPQLMSRNNW